MKKQLLFALLASSTFWIKAQTTVTLDTSNIRALIPSTPLLFWDGTNASVFNAPKSGLKNTIFTSTPWIGGINNNNLYLAAETYRQNGTDYQAGPITNTPDSIGKWDVVKVSKNMINAFIADSSMWSNPPAPIAKWPAHGDTLKGQAFWLAPFVNVGGDPYIYEPQFGDYPKIKGDQCAYFIFNDNKIHQESGGLPMKMEIHRMVYEIADTNAFLNNSVFVEYTLFNRSMYQYDSSIFSVYSDYDIGKYDDDYIGTDSVLRMVYGYNGMDNDIGGYGLNPPAEGLVVLNKPLASSMYYSNDNTNQGNPITTNHFFNYMNANWKDSTWLTYGNNGKGGTVRSWYAYSGDVCNQTAWTEGNIANAPGDRRILANIDLGSFGSGERRRIEFAYLYARGTSGAQSSVCELKNQAQKLITYYELNAGVKDVAKQTIGSSIYPNPSNGSFTIQSKVQIQTVEIFDITGKLVQSKTILSKQANIDQLEAGIYFVKVNGKEGFETKKVIVQ